MARARRKMTKPSRQLHPGHRDENKEEEEEEEEEDADDDDEVKEVEGEAANQ